MASKKKELYDNGYMLTDYQRSFMDNFKATHDFDRALKMLQSNVAAESIKGALKLGGNDLSKCYADYINSAPTHPEVNKVVILNDLVRLKNMAFEDGDTALLMKVIPEINKMIKGNLAGTATTKEQTKLVGIIDLTRRNDNLLSQGHIIDVSHNISSNDDDDDDYN